MLLLSKGSKAVTTCSTKSIRIQMAEIINNCDNQDWKVNNANVTSQTDHLPQDFLYHKMCMNEQWQKWGNQ